MKRHINFLQQVYLLFIIIFFTVQTAYTQVPYPGSGNWLELDGVDDYARTDDNPYLDIGNYPGDDFTIECWFYIPDLNANTNQALIYKEWSYSLALSLESSGKDKIYFQIYYAPEINACLTYNIMSDLSLGWHHVAAVFENDEKSKKNKVKIFLDGSKRKDSKVRKLKKIFNSGTPLCIGANSGLLPFYGKIDEVRISDNIRYSGKKYTVPTSDFTVDANTRALWHFSEAGLETTFYDATGNNNTLTGYSGASALPVELNSFTSAADGPHVKLSWTTATEINNYGFYIERRMAELPFEEWESTGFIPGSGNSNSPKEYSFFDKYLAPGRYEYRLKQVDIDGGYEYSWIIDVKVRNVQYEIELYKNYPNPFNPSTVISFKINKSSFVSLKIFELTGREVATIVNEELPPGNYSREWNAGGMSSGIYLYCLQAGSFCESRKLMLVK